MQSCLAIASLLLLHFICQTLIQKASHLLPKYGSLVFPSCFCLEKKCKVEFFCHTILATELTFRWFKRKGFYQSIVCLFAIEVFFCSGGDICHACNQHRVLNSIFSFVVLSCKTLGKKKKENDIFHIIKHWPIVRKINSTIGLVKVEFHPWKPWCIRWARFDPLQYFSSLNALSYQNWVKVGGGLLSVFCSTLSVFWLIIQDCRLVYARSWKSLHPYYKGSVILFHFL